MSEHNVNVKIFFRHPRPEYNSIEEVFATTLAAFPGTVCYERVELPYTGAGLRAILKNMLYARRHRGEINHITGDAHYIALVTGRNTILTIHDSNSALNGSWIRRIFVRILWFWLPALCVKRITVISPKSAREVCAIIPFARNKICVIPNPYNPRVLEGSSNPASGNGKPIVFLPGTKVNKNLERTVEALSGLGVRTLILGELSAAQKALLDGFHIDYENHFHVPYAVVAELYRRCDLVCFASLYEGFGVPVIEAQLAGKAVVTSDVEPMNWVAGDGACLVDPLQVLSIRDGLCRVLNDENYRRDLVERGRKNLSRFEPRLIAGLYRDVYAEVAAN